LAWNSGTTVRIESRATSPNASAAQAASACNTVERWLYITPFGLPVVPEV
jgi:hypothetical protein